MSRQDIVDISGDRIARTCLLPQMENEYELLTGNQTWLAGKPPFFPHAGGWENHRWKILIFLPCFCSLVTAVVEVPHNMQNRWVL